MQSLITTTPALISRASARAAGTSRAENRRAEAIGGARVRLGKRKIGQALGAARAASCAGAIEPARGDAGVAAIQRAAEFHRALDEIEIGVVADHHRVIAGELRDDRNGARGGGLQHEFSRRGRAGEDHEIHAGLERGVHFAHLLRKTWSSAAGSPASAAGASSAEAAAVPPTPGFQRTALPAARAWSVCTPGRKSG